LQSAIELRVHKDVRARLRKRDCTSDLDCVQAAYLRPYDSTRLPDVAQAGAGSRAWSHAINFHDCLWTWAELASVLVVNRPSAMATNSSKPFQSRLIRTAGFNVPETLLTTDSRAALEFCERYGDVVYKSISSVRSIVSKLGRAQRTRLSDLASCPTQFQEHVEGLDYRVHVVGDAVYCSMIVSDADDYRYARGRGVSVEVRPASLEDGCADRCRMLARAMALPVAGIDLRLTPTGVWYCFEVNASPAFTFPSAVAVRRGPGSPIRRSRRIARRTRRRSWGRRVLPGAAGSARGTPCPSPGWSRCGRT